jgi:spore coat polysaccharide biosynthesis predicted glycosyltransferase SpsG
VKRVQTPVDFVVRSSIQDGLGHLVRSLCVAKELVRVEPVRVVRIGDGSGAHLLAEAGLPSIDCPTDEDAADVVLAGGARLCVFDTLRFDASAFACVAEAATTVSLSPEFSCLAATDHLIHRTEREDPRWNKTHRFPRIHKGLQYTILPSWLKRIPERTYREHASEDRLAVAISMGGSDASNRTLELLELLGEAPCSLVVFIALGDAYTHSYEKLLRHAESNRQEVILVKSNESMWRVLRTASLLLCAGGLTTYESVFVGIPSINVLHRNEWSYLFEELTETGACATVFSGRDSFSLTIERVVELYQNRSSLFAMHAATRGLIRRGGAKRVTELLCRLNSAKRLRA